MGYTLVLLPETPMEPRQNDDRLLYFDTQYQDKGSHQKQARLRRFLGLFKPCGTSADDALGSIK